MRWNFSAAVLIVLAVTSLAAAQRTPTSIPRNTNFVIDAARPFVYIEYLKTGPREPVLEGEPPTGVWLRLVNNCTVPIRIRTFGAGGKAFGAENVMYEVVYDEYFGVVSYTADGKREPPEQTPRSEMPRGYSFDVGSATILQPGKAITFDAPVNHIAEDWHIEVRFEFVLPGARRQQPKMDALFTFYDVPEIARPAFWTRFRK